MPATLRSSILRHVRILVSQDSLNLNLSSAVQLVSSHNEHLDKDESVALVSDVVKSFPKVDQSKVTLDVHFQEDLGLDILDNVEIVMTLENEFKLEIPNMEADKIDSCHLAIEYIHNNQMVG